MQIISSGTRITVQIDLRLSVCAFAHVKDKGKVIPLQVQCGPEGG